MGRYSNRKDTQNTREPKPCIGCAKPVTTVCVECGGALCKGCSSAKRIIVCEGCLEDSLYGQGNE